MYPWETNIPKTYSYPQNQMIPLILNQFSNPYFLKYVSNFIYKIIFRRQKKINCAKGKAVETD